MARNDNERPFFHFHLHLGRRRNPISLCVCFIQQFHTLKIHCPLFHDQRKQILHLSVLADSCHPFIEKCVYLIIGISQDHGMVSIGRGTSQSKQQKGFQGTDIFLVLPKFFHRIISGPSAGFLTGHTSGYILCSLLMHCLNLLFQGFIIKVYICQSCKQALHHEAVCLRFRFILPHRLGKSDQSPCQLILKLCGGILFPAHSSVPFASAASCSLFTLITKHFFFHPCLPLLFCWAHLLCHGLFMIQPIFNGETISPADHLG